VTLDAMHWVWNHSQSRGNARTALLFVADQVRTSSCEVRLSYADFVRALNASRSVAKAAVQKAVDSGELQVIEQGKGTRPSLYSLPKAVGFIRPSVSSGPESGPLGDLRSRPSGPESSPLGTDHDHASGPESGPEWAGIRPSSGPESGPHSPSPVPSKQEGEPEGSQPEIDYGIPRNVRPLIDAMTRAGLGYIRWPFEGNQWFVIEALIKKSGIDAMTTFAAKAASRTNVESAKYFIPGWRQLAPLPPGYSPSSRDSPPPPAGPHCGDIDCHPDTRLREVEDDEGLPVLIPCSTCHPATQGARR
jgi:hypothetical protein